MYRQRQRVTPLRREVLNRLFEAGRPLSFTEAKGDHPNIMPTLLRFGWARYRCDGYVITSDGMTAIGFENVESEASLSSQKREGE